jgi:hypothetical protein
VEWGFSPTLSPMGRREDHGAPDILQDSSPLIDEQQNWPTCPVWQHRKQWKGCWLVKAKTFARVFLVNEAGEAILGWELYNETDHIIEDIEEGSVPPPSRLDDTAKLGIVRKCCQSPSRGWSQRLELWTGNRPEIICSQGRQHPRPC